MIRTRQNDPDNKTYISYVISHLNRHLIGLHRHRRRFSYQSICPSCAKSSWTLNTLKTPTNQKKIGTKFEKSPRESPLSKGREEWRARGVKAQQELLKWMHPQANTSDIGMRTFLLFYISRFESCGLNSQGRWKQGSISSDAAKFHHPAQYWIEISCRQGRQAKIRLLELPCCHQIQ